MKTCTIKSVYEAIVRMRGIDPLTAGLSAAQKSQIADYINGRIIEGYTYAFWPEIMLAEQRQYRATWDAILNYATGDEVFHVDAAGGENYYVSLLDGNVGKDPDTETTCWQTVGDEFLRTISFRQQGETEMGAVDLQNCIFDKDPRIYRFAGLVRDVISYEGGILISANKAPVRPWVWFRPPPPEYSLAEWSATATYAIGDIWYYATSGECYKALQPSTGKNPYSETGHWQPVDFPAFLKKFVTHGAHADYLLDPVERAKEESIVVAELASLEERLVDQRGVERKVIWGR